jgi:hypothetical protein
MAPTPEILRAARAAFFSHAILWIPAFLTVILQDMVLPLAARGGHPGQALSGLMAGIGAVMIGAGWLAMIGVALRDGTPGLKDFADGVNARWVPIVVGNLVYWLVVLALAAIAFSYAHGAYGWDQLVAWIKPMLELPPERQQAALDPTKLPPAVLGWMNVAMAWFATFLLVNAILVFWQPLVVLQGQGWLEAWVGSARLFGRRFGQVLSIGALHLGGLFLARMLMASMQPLPTLVGVALYVGVVGLFTVAYAAVVVDAYPPPGAQVDLEA